MRRLDTQLLIVDWPEDPPDELREAVVQLTTFETANPAPVSVARDAGDSVLLWRGYLTGGLLTLYERLVPLLDEYGLTGVFTTGALQLCLEGGADQVTALGVLRCSVQLDRRDLDERVRSVASVEELMEQLLRDSLTGAERVIWESREQVSEEHPAGHAFLDVPEELEQVAPGEVDLGLLEDADSTLIVEYDPEDNYTEGKVVRDLLRFRTEFLAPGTVGLPKETYARSFSWRIAQWEYRSDSDEGDDSGEADERRFLGWRESDLAEITSLIPEDLSSWALRATRQAVEGLAAWVEESDDRESRERLRTLQTQLSTFGK